MLHQLRDVRITVDEENVILAESIFRDVLRRRRAGEAVSDEQVLREHEDLRELLAGRLARLKTVQSALATPPSERSFVPPFISERYDILKEINHGGQAIVYLARDRETSRNVALKVLRSGTLADERERQRFEREAEILSSIAHPNIVSVLDRGRTREGLLYLVMSYIPGEPMVAESLAARPMAERIALFIRVCRAVQAAHERQVVHRDLKPSNIRIDDHGAPHILDFGLAVSQQSLLASMTVTGQFLGTFLWASPEQAEGRVGDAITPASDVYSLGVILHQLVTGGAFPPQVFAVVRQAIDREAKTRSAAERPRRRRERRSDVLPVGLAAIIDKCLAQKPGDRYGCAGEVAEALESFLASPPPPRRQSMVRLAGGVLAGLALICGIAAFLLHAGDHTDSQAGAPEPRPGYVSSEGIEMVWISPGEADLGTPPGEYPRMSDEMIRHVKFERGFYLATTELSVEMYRQVMGTIPAEVSGDRQLPITWVSWNDAQEFCQRLSRRSNRHYRLPTEDEWEYAARAGQRTAYPWYIEDPAGGRWPLLSRYANFADSTSSTDHSDRRYSDGSPTLALSRAFQPNRLGLYSMMGNVWEWTGSAYNESSHSRLAPTTDRQVHYVTKGGSWFDDALTFRFGNRNPLAGDFRGGNVGFRVVCDDPQQ